MSKRTAEQVGIVGIQLADIIRWWACVVWFEACEMWRAMPGPWWCKVALIAILLAIPGQVDEIALLVVLSALRKRRARKFAAQAR